MDSIGFFPLLWWALGASLLVGAAIYGYMEYNAYLLRTEVTGIPGGLRFVSKVLEVEARYGPKQLVVEVRSGEFRRKPLPEGDETVQTGALTATLPAPGAHIQVFRIVEREQGAKTPIETGFSSIVFNASDELTMRATKQPTGERLVLRMDGVPNAIAHDFQRFANGLQTWLDKIEHGLKREIEEQRQREEEAERAAARAAALAKAAQNPSVALTDAQREAMAAEQIAAWRTAAGFKGNATEVSIDPSGAIRWFIDLDPAGRAILHADHRTFYGSLLGSTVTSLGGELEVAVRDDYWTEDDPRLVAFRILGGASPDLRRAWKERLDILVQHLNKGLGK
jgi:hypothetical protein